MDLEARLVDENASTVALAVVANQNALQVFERDCVDVEDIALQEPAMHAPQSVIKQS